MGHRIRGGHGDLAGDLCVAAHELTFEIIGDRLHHLDGAHGLGARVGEADAVAATVDELDAERETSHVSELAVVVSDPHAVGAHVGDL